MSQKPLVCLPANIFDYRGSPGHIARDTYIRALSDISGVMPVITPLFNQNFDAKSLISRVDGIVLTGSASHVNPDEYKTTRSFDDDYLDLARDHTSLELIRAALDSNKPILAICRGFQELNVVTGGTLYQDLKTDTDSTIQHGQVEGATVIEALERQAHNMNVEKGGLFDTWDIPKTFITNSIHQQGIKTLGNGLTVEARADDDLIEAISVTGHKFALGVQWHPEGDHHINPVSHMIFEKFKEAF